MQYGMDFELQHPTLCKAESEPQVPADRKPTSDHTPLPLTRKLDVSAGVPAGSTAPLARANDKL